MMFILGLFLGTAMGVILYKYYLMFCNQKEVVCNKLDKDRRLQSQFERLISYGFEE